MLRVWAFIGLILQAAAVLQVKRCPPKNSKYGIVRKLKAFGSRSKGADRPLLEVVNFTHFQQEVTDRCLCKKGSFWNVDRQKCVPQGDVGFNCSAFPKDIWPSLCKDGYTCKDEVCTECGDEDNCKVGKMRHKATCAKEYDLSGQACVTLRVTVPPSVASATVTKSVTVHVEAAKNVTAEGSAEVTVSKTQKARAEAEATKKAVVEVEATDKAEVQVEASVSKTVERQNTQTAVVKATAKATGYAEAEKMGVKAATDAEAEGSSEKLGFGTATVAATKTASASAQASKEATVKSKGEEEASAKGEAEGSGSATVTKKVSGNFTVPVKAEANATKISTKTAKGEAQGRVTAEVCISAVEAKKAANKGTTKLMAEAVKQLHLNPQIPDVFLVQSMAANHCDKKDADFVQTKALEEVYKRAKAKGIELAYEDGVKKAKAKAIAAADDKEPTIGQRRTHDDKQH
jgi:hypothetical protein